MDNEFLTINQVCKYLKIKPSTLYSWARVGEIPHYKIHNMIRFRKDDIDTWMQAHRKESIEADKRTIELSKVTKKPNVDVSEVIKTSIEQIKKNRYTSLYGKPNRDKAGKEVSDGTLS